MRPESLLAGLVAMGLAFASTSGRAAYLDTNATMTGLALSVIDLTPDDGKAAGFNYQAIDTTYYLTLDFPGRPPATMTHTGQGGPINLRLDEYGSFIELDADTLGDFSLHSSLVPKGGGRSWGQAEIRHTFDLMLEPNTVVVLTGDMSQSLTRDGGIFRDSGHASTRIRYQTIPGEMQSGSLFYDLDWHLPGVTQYSDDIYFTFANADDHKQLVQLSISLAMSSTITFVPEPSTYALLLAGIAVIAGIPHRGRRIGSYPTVKEQ